MKSGQTGLLKTFARDAATVLGTVCLIVCLSTVAHAESEVTNAQIDADITTTQSQGTSNLKHNTVELDRARQVRCLAEAVYYEAKGEPRRGQEAVAEVVATRVASKGYPKSFCGVVYQRRGQSCQFSWACGTKRTPTGLQWQRANEIAERVVDGWRPGIAPGATHFHASVVSPNWSRVYKRVNAIGGHVFYRQIVR